MLIISLHYCSVQDFSISFQGALWECASWNLQIDSQPTIFIWSSWILVEWYKSEHGHNVSDFSISGHATQKWGQSWKQWMNVDGFLHDGSMSYISISEHVTQKWHRRSKSWFVLSLLLSICISSLKMIPVQTFLRLCVTKFHDGRSRDSEMKSKIENTTRIIWFIFLLNRHVCFVRKWTCAVSTRLKNKSHIATYSIPWGQLATATVLVERPAGCAWWQRIWLTGRKEGA